MAKRKKKRMRKARLIVMTIFLILMLAIIAVFGFLWMRYGGRIRSAKEEATRIASESRPSDFQSSEGASIYDTNGRLITTLSQDTRDRADLSYDEIPENVINAFVAIEDRSFWSNKGYDLKGVARILANYVISHGEVRQGASTITQQLARNIYLTSDKTIDRKLTEIFLASELTTLYSKEDIITAYVNNVYFANNFYGIEAAAQGYFGKSASELSLSETAYIAAIPNRPAYYDPWGEDPNNALERRDKILEDMCECGYITEAQRDEALAEQIMILAQNVSEVSVDDSVSAQDETFSSYAINCATEYLMGVNGFDFRYSYDTQTEYEDYKVEYNDAYEEAKQLLYTKPYQIYTSLDPEAQTNLQSIVDTKLSSYTEVDAETGIYTLQAAMTAIDNSTGKIIALIGGRSQEEASGGLNRAYQSYRQPGSTMKPLVVYTPALMQGYDANSLLQEISVKEANKEGTDVDALTGYQMTLRSAVEQSKNGCAYYLYNIIKPKNGLEFLAEMDFKNIVPADNNLASCLGGLTYGVNTNEMAAAYAAISYDGTYRGTTCLTDIIDPDGKSIYSDPEEKAVYSEDAAEQMTDILEGVITRGTGTAAQLSRSFTAAGKTGTTNDNKDAWFCGFAPATGYAKGQGYTVSVYLGYDIPKEDEAVSGGRLTAEIWKEAMEALISDTEEFVTEEARYSYDGTYDMYEDDTVLDQTNELSARAAMSSMASATTLMDLDTYYASALSYANSITDETLKSSLISEIESTYNTRKSALGGTDTNANENKNDPATDTTVTNNTGTDTEINTPDTGTDVTVPDVQTPSENTGGEDIGVGGGDEILTW